MIRELVRRGEHIDYYNTEPFREPIERAGARFRAYSASAKFPRPGEGPGPFASLTTTLESQLEATCAILDGHLGEVEALGSPVIVHDSFAPWGGLVAQLLKLPTITTVPSIFIDGEIDARHGSMRKEDPALTVKWCANFQTLLKVRLSRYALTRLLSPPELLQTYGDLNFAFTSRMFQPLAERFDPGRFLFVGPCFEGRTEVPFPVEWIDGQRPLVLISLGTVYGNHPEFYRRCLDELAGAPWQVVIATGGCGCEGPVPDNCMVRRTVPQVALLARCAAFVTHGGINSTHEALFHGVPLVIAPQGADQFWISARAAELGCAIVIDSSRLELGAIRDSVARVLSEPGYKAAAGRAGESLRAAGGSVRAADEIERFVQRTMAPGQASPDPLAPYGR